jgi:hypothetical protein
MRRLLVLLTVVSVPLLARADFAIQFTDVPGSDGHWHQGTAIIPAPVEQVIGWLTDYDHWSQIFSDISTSRMEGVTTDGGSIVRFHSRIAQRTIVIREYRTSFGLVYDGGSNHVRVQGRIFVTDLGDGRTEVTMQSSARVQGPLRAFVTERMVRSRENALMQAHLSSLYELSRSPARVEAASR